MGSTCTTDATCTVNGTCTTGNTGAICTASGSTAQCALANGYCATIRATRRRVRLPTRRPNAPARAESVATIPPRAAPTPRSARPSGDARSRVRSARRRPPPRLSEPAGSEQSSQRRLRRQDRTQRNHAVADANGMGNACRRNNHAYADGTTASQTNYPSGKYTTPVIGEAVAGAGCPRDQSLCHAFRATTGRPRSSGATSRSPPPATSGSVTATRDRWHRARRSRTRRTSSRASTSSAQPPGTDNVSQAAFARVDLTSHERRTYTHTWTDDTGDRADGHPHLRRRR